jgi:ATP-dependent DNA helicase RecG
MPEQQNIEYKQSWHDDGNVIVIADYKKLMDDIPNKIRNTMGITAEVNLHEEEGKYFIEIVTHPYSVPISVRGRYYYRSGSTKQELTGAALNEFLLKKSGKTWDDVIEARATFDDIDEKTVKIFLAASKNTGRLPGK